MREPCKAGAVDVLTDCRHVDAEMADSILLEDRFNTIDVYLVQAMLYLCSDQASFVTGQTLDVSGGFPLYI